MNSEPEVERKVAVNFTNFRTWIGLCTNLILIFLWLVFGSCGGRGVVAQTTTGTLVGNVVDEQNQPLPDVLIRVKNLSNGFTYVSQTRSEGLYRVEFLPPGTYQITAEKDGFQSGGIDQFTGVLNATREIRIPPITLFRITAGGAANLLNDTGPGVNVTDSTHRGGSPASFFSLLPIGGLRSIDTLALLEPGVFPAPATPGGTGPGVGPGVGTAGQFSVNGTRARGNNFTIDGSDNNDQDIGVRRQGFTTPQNVGVEEITEFQITTLLADAEAGRNTGGQINLVALGGFNHWHGQVFRFVSHQSLSARDPFDFQWAGNPAKNPFSRHQTGVLIGGPLIKNRLVILLGLERKDLHQQQELHFATPTLSERAGALAFGNDPLLFDLYFQRLDFIPLPNNPGGPYRANTFTRVLPASGDATIGQVKADAQFSLFGRPTTASFRYVVTDDSSQISAIDQALNSQVNALTRTHNVALTLNSDLSPSTANQLRFSYGQTRLGFDEVAGNPLVFSSPEDTTGPVGRISVLPFSPLGIDPFTFPQTRTNHTFQIADTFALIQGRRIVKFGFDLRRIQFNSRLDRNYRTQLTFSSGVKLGADLQTTTPVSGLFLAARGTPSDAQQALAIESDSRIGLRTTELNLFVHSRFQVTSRLMLEIGGRYERNTVPKDATGRIGRSLRLQPSDFGANDPMDPAVGEFLKTFRAYQDVLGNRSGIYEPDANNFAIRTGFALDLTGNGSRSIRGGYGLFYDALLGTIVSQSRNVFPGYIPINLGIQNPFDKQLPINPSLIQINGNRLVSQGNTIGIPQDQLAAGLGSLFLLQSFAIGFTLPEKELRTPVVHQAGLTIEQMFPGRLVVSLSGVVTWARGLLRQRTPNGGTVTPYYFFKGTLNPSFPGTFRPQPSLGGYTVFESSARSHYAAVHVAMTRQFQKGPGFQVGYTFSHAIDDVSDVFDLGGSSALAQDELNRHGGLRAERGNAAFDVRHRLTGAFGYRFPAGRGLGQWLAPTSISGIVTVQTGQPFTIQSSLDINQDGNLTDRLHSTDGVIAHSSGATQYSLASGDSPFDNLAPRLSRSDGNIGRNTFRSRGLASLDLALAKNFKFNREHQLSLRIEAFNIFNRAHFGIPERILESPGFGISNSTTILARRLQLAIRYSF